MNNTWNYSEFLVFFLIYASHADIDYSKDEKELIKSLVSQEAYDKLYKLFINMTDFSALEIILSYRKKFFATPESKKLLLGKLDELFLADEDYSILERQMHGFLERLM